MLEETIKARGHGNVTSRHRNTLEFTKEDYLTPRGDCIVAIEADMGLCEFSEDFKEALRDEKTVLEITIECNKITDNVVARGHPDLRLTHPTDMVVRKSGFVCDRTLAVHANKAAIDLKRGLVRELRQGGDAVIELKITKSK